MELGIICSIGVGLVVVDKVDNNLLRISYAIVFGIIISEILDNLRGLLHYKNAEDKVKEGEKKYNLKQ